MKKIVILLLMFAGTSFGQNGSSLMSRFGVGELNPFLTSRQRGMGAVATALPSEYDINQTNPALWASLQELRLQGGLSYENSSFSRNSDFASGNTGIKELQFVLPFREAMNLHLVTGFLPYSRVDYQVKEDGIVQGGESYTSKYYGTGGISLFRFGAAVQPFPFLQVGAAYQYHFGTIDNEWDVTFSNSSYYPTFQRRSTGHSGSGATLGIAVTPVADLTIGASFTSGVTLNATENLVLAYSTNDSSITGAHNQFDLPARVSFGASYQLSKRILISSELVMQDWSGSPSFDQKQTPLARTYRIGTGVEWLPSGMEHDKSFWSQSPIRFGAYMQQNYIRLNNDNANETMLTAGWGFPVFSHNRADISFEYGWRGAPSNTLGLQTLFRFSVSISVGESWFVRRNAD